MATNSYTYEFNQTTTYPEYKGRSNSSNINTKYPDSIGHEYSVFFYRGFAFERPIYLYIWEILVVITCLFNAVVISVLLRKRMRNVTYMILTAISISDSLTGLVTLPSYIAVYQKFSPETPQNAQDFFNATTVATTDYHFTEYYYEDDEYYEAMLTRDTSHPTSHPKSLEGYALSHDMCEGFMISKFFLSKCFHTVSVWLTLFLAFQRFLSVRGVSIKHWLTVKHTVWVCVVIFCLAPLLHIYHLFDDHSVGGLCEWRVLKEGDCVDGCAYLWIAFLLGHLLPSVLLVLFTGVFIYHLTKSVNNLMAIGSTKSKAADDTFRKRQQENRRVSYVVLAIVIVFLIPELPYSGFLLYAAIAAHADIRYNLATNRAIHAAYEILLVLSFSANFYIYTFFNSKFRKVLKETLIKPIAERLCQKRFPRFDFFSSLSSQSTPSSKTGYEMTQVSTKSSQDTDETQVKDKSLV